MAQAEGHKQVSSANADCSVNCLNGGYCSFTKYTDYPQKGDVGYYPSCVCRPGFGGPSCENTVDECQPPYFKCHNGAPCIREETSGSLSCDCSFADDKSVLAGYMCRNPVTQACDTLGENDNNKSFCTNGGVCLSSLKATSKELVFSEPTVHEGCQCDRDFSGIHCEFINGMPESTLVKTNPPEKYASVNIGVSLSVLAAFALFVAVFVIKRKRQIRYRLDQSKSWDNGEERFRKFYSDMRASNNMSTDDGGINDKRDDDYITEVAMKGHEEDAEKEEGKEGDNIVQTILEKISAESQYEPYEAEEEPKIV